MYMIYWSHEIEKSGLSHRGMALFHGVKRMEIEVVDISVLNPARYNPRKALQQGDPAYEKLKASIKEFDYVEPIIWNKRTGHVVGGHQRLSVLKDLGYTQAHVSVVDMDDEREAALNLALNKISGEWDDDKLAALLDDLRPSGLYEVTGFDETEINQLLSDVLPFDDLDPDEYPEPNLDDQGMQYQSQYGVIVHCDGEQEQQAAYENLVGMGYSCKVVVV